MKAETVNQFKSLTDSHSCWFWFSHGKVAASSKPDFLSNDLDLYTLINNAFNWYYVAWL